MGKRSLHRRLRFPRPHTQNPGCLEQGELSSMFFTLSSSHSSGLHLSKIETLEMEQTLSDCLNVPECCRTKSWSMSMVRENMADRTGTILGQKLKNVCE